MDTGNERFFSYPTRKRELFFALGCLLCSLFLANVILFGGFNLGFAIGICALILCSGIYLLARGCKPTPYSLTLLVLSMAIAASFARSDDFLVKFVMVCFLTVSISLGLCLLAAKNRRDPGRVSSLADAAYTFFAIGFLGMAPAFRGLGDSVRNSGSFGKKGSAIALGIGISLPMLLVIIPLLMQADAAFEGLLQKLPEISFAEILLTAFFGIILAWLQYARGTALKYHAPSPLGIRIPKGLSTLTVNTVLGTVCFVYLVYLFSQLAYFSGGFSGILPQEYTLAEYARRGFFEMAWLCAINLSIIIFALWISFKKDPAPLSSRLLCLFIGLVTLFLVSTASAKMVMYIDSYGLTRLRVLTQVIMCFLAIVTVLVCVWLFVRKLPYMKAVMLCALAIGAAVSWTDVDTVVAHYNTTAYLEGRMKTIDMEYLEWLGDGSVPYLAKLVREAPDAEVAKSAQNILKNRWDTTAKDFRGWNYTDAAAKQEIAALRKDVLWLPFPSRVLDFDFPKPQTNLFKDNRNSAREDGIAHGIATFSAEDGMKICRNMEASNHWKSLPLNKDLTILLHGGSDNGTPVHPALAEAVPDLPQITNGYYLFYDRHINSGNPTQTQLVLSRDELHLTLAIYDADTHTLYFWEADI